MSAGVIEPPAWHLRLFVAGQTPRSLLATANLLQLCETHLAGRYEVEVVDLVEHPSRARGDDIVAIPTLVRCEPQPRIKVIGDLSDPEVALASLGIPPVVQL